jgi:hypothetical protein
MKEARMCEDHSRDAGSRIIMELLMKPGFKDDIRDAGRALVKAILWQDVEFTLGVLGALPAIANTLIRTLDELLLQVNEKFSLELLQGFLGSMLEDIDKETLRRAILNLRPLIEELAPIFQRVWHEAMQEGDLP